MAQSKKAWDGVFSLPVPERAQQVYRSFKSYALAR